jgi:Fe-S cluster assembly protein SufD
MTMLQKIETLTETEQALLAAAGNAPSTPQRRRAAAVLREHGLPTRKVERWHYTDLRSRLVKFGLPSKASAADGEAWLKSAKAFIAGARLPFLGGHYLEGDADPLPAGVEAKPADAAGFRDADDAVALIDSLLCRGGLEITVEPERRVDGAVCLVHGAAGAGSSALRHRVNVGAGAHAIFAEQYSSPDGLDIQTVVVVDLRLSRGAEAQWIILQEEGDRATHLTQLNVEMEEGSRLSLLALNAGGSLVRREINVVSKGSNSTLDIRGVNLIGGEAHIDVTTSIVHEAPDTISTETFRNVATDRGNGIFQGQISVERAAQKTDARMACNTLLLSDEAGFSAKPELEIFADDVQCGHGATVTDILDDHLFYLRARGIAERDARAMLVKAFVEEVFDDCENDDVRQALNRHIEDWLERNG